MTGELWCSESHSLAAKSSGEAVSWKTVVYFCYLDGLWTHISEKRSDVSTAGVQQGRGQHWEGYAVWAGKTTIMWLGGTSKALLYPRTFVQCLHLGGAASAPALLIFHHGLFPLTQILLTHHHF